MTFVSLIGLGIAAVVFLNLLQAKDSVERIGKEPAPRVKLGSQDAADLKDRARMRRICPVCRTGLATEEYLICAMEPEDPGSARRKRQVQIYGCVHCFATDGINLAKYEKIKDLEV
ncbi:MAG: hypothetical protein NXI24_14995 [bacterium]|nr:hypothetical protein [bacterium]